MYNCQSVSALFAACSSYCFFDFVEFCNFSSFKFLRHRSYLLTVVTAVRATQLFIFDMFLITRQTGPWLHSYITRATKTPIDGLKICSMKPHQSDGTNWPKFVQQRWIALHTSIQKCKRQAYMYICQMCAVMTDGNKWFCFPYPMLFYIWNCHLSNSGQFD